MRNLRNAIRLWAWREGLVENHGLDDAAFVAAAYLFAA
jgi:hypothetical protein